MDAHPRSMKFIGPGHHRTCSRRSWM